MLVLEKVIIDNVLNFIESDRRAGHESISRVTQAIGLVTWWSYNIMTLFETARYINVWNGFKQRAAGDTAGPTAGAAECPAPGTHDLLPRTHGRATDARTPPRGLLPQFLQSVFQNGRAAAVQATFYRFLGRIWFCILLYGCVSSSIVQKIPHLCSSDFVLQTGSSLFKFHVLSERGGLWILSECCA